MSQNKFALHPDFQEVRLPSMSFDSSPWRMVWILRFINIVLRLQHVFSSQTKTKNSVRTKIVGSDGNKIKITLIRPNVIRSNMPALVYFHGGAFVLTHAPAHIAAVKKYADGAGCCVIFVDYRLAPKNCFPRGFNDAYSALLWAVTQADILGFDKNRIAVGGDSAGGALAASVAQKAVANGITLCGQLLIYPVLDSRCTSPSAIAFTDTPVFNANANRKMWDVYLQGVDRKNPPPYMSPVLESCTNLAPALIEIAEFDPLRDEGRAYANVLLSNGVAVDLIETKGTVHGYDVLIPDSEISKVSLSRRIAFLTKIFS